MSPCFFVLKLLMIHREFTDSNIFYWRSFADLSDLCCFVEFFWGGASGSCCLRNFNLFKDYSLISHGHRFQNPAMERPIDSLCCFMASPLSPESISQLQCVGKPLCDCVRELCQFIVTKC